MLHYKDIQPYNNYTEDEIINIVSQAKNKTHYDEIIERLYFQDEKQKGIEYKNRSKYSILHTRKAKRIRKKEYAYIDEMKKH